MAGLRVRVFVTPKQGILDPQGKAVQHGLHALGFAEVDDVRVGKVIDLHVRESDPGKAEARVRTMCNELLANEVIEDFRVEVRSPEG